MNAKKELLIHVKGKNVELVKIALSKGYDEDPLRIEGTLEKVLPQLDFDYDEDSGYQNLFGYIWYADGSWSERGEHDGDEWWQSFSCPDKNIKVDVP